MMEDQLRYLLSLYLVGTLTDNQRKELVALLGDERAALLLDELMPADWELEDGLGRTEERIVAAVIRRMEAAREVGVGDEGVELGAMVRRDVETAAGGKIRRMGGWRKWGWAAAAVVLIGTCVYLWDHNQQKAVVSVSVADVAAGKDRAVLVLGDGTKMELDSTANGQIAQQGGTSVVKQGPGRIDYKSLAQGGNGAIGSDLMNTLCTPRGGQYRLVLPDGTQVWLNAASSITFPTAFPDHERRVKISGEAYVEVVSDKARPFIAEVDGGMPVEVLGTSFDINSYADEEAVKTTLVEGKVKLGEIVLKPGQQVQVRGGQVKAVAKADVEKVLAWKNGLFDFDNAGLAEVMRQIGRWYDVEVVYEKGVPNIQFEGQISRNISLSDLLKALARADVKFKIDQGRKLIVSP